MGVPALFRWLSRKYPKIVSPVIETSPDEVQDAEGNITKIPVDATKPNPNGEEFDNLYLDMNGIVHPCSHPEDRPAPANEAEMMTAIFEYTDRVVNMVRPRKLLMIAVDGVAPRAKMNQQRSRRFKSAQEAAEKDKAAAEFYAQIAAKGDSTNEEDATDTKPKKTWDSNSITPGTPFMDLLAASLRYWVSYKLSTDPAWEKIKVIISDATVPGEGEHKIMNFVRSQRSSPDHDPNTRHVMYGLDADLIMLGIATHEPHFRILREDVFANDTKPGHCRKCNQPGHIAANCQGKAPVEDPTIAKPLKPFIWLHVGILREYLAVEMNVPNLGFRFDLERALDDWVFMCFFVGNDFLPHLPSLDIREDGIDTLIAIWRDNIPVMGGWVTKDGYADQARVQVMLDGLSKQENAIFKRRRENEARAEEKNRRRAENEQRQAKRMRMSGGEPTGYDETIIRRGPNGGIIKGEAAPDINALPTFAPGAAQTKSDPRYAATLTHADVVGGGRPTHNNANQGNRSAAAALKESLQNTNGANAVLGKRGRDLVEAADEGSTDPSTPGRSTPNAGTSKPTDRGTSGALGGNSNDNADAMPEDSVKLWEDGYQGRYYEQKFHVSANDIEFRRKVANSYVEGLCWVLLYYFQGCPSWTWYYPYHYAPFAQDFFEIEKHEFTFSKGKPFRPYEQLMGVLPAASNHAIPAVFHPLMTDEDSPIKEFYPVDFDVDLNGKKFAWQGVVLLPFIDEKRLLDAMATKYPLLTEEEVRRNGIGNEALIFSTKHPLYNDVVANFYGKKAMHLKFSINTKSSEGLAGTLLKDEAYVPNSELVVPFDNAQHEEYRDLEENDTVRAVYEMPEVLGVHKSMLLPGITFSDPVLDYHDIQQTRDRAERSGRSFGGVQLSQHGDRSDGRRINYSAGDRGGPRGGNWSSGPIASAFPNLPPYLAQQAANHGMPVPGMQFPGGPPPMPQGWPPASYGGPGGPPPHRGGASSEYGGGGHGNGEYGGSSYGRNGSGNSGSGNGNGYGYGNGGYNNDGYGNGGYNNGGYNHGGSGYGANGGSGYGGGRHDGGSGRRGRDGYGGGGYGGNANGYGYQNGQGGSGRRY